MGGGGAWEFARAFPHEVAALVPISASAAVGSLEAVKPLQSVPIWAFHARGDALIKIEESYSFMNFIYQGITKKAERLEDFYPATSKSTKTVAIENRAVWIVYEGINPGHTQDKLLTIYPHSAHDAWTETYYNHKLWSWLFSKSR